MTAAREFADRYVESRQGTATLSQGPRTMIS